MTVDDFESNFSGKLAGFFIYASNWLFDVNGNRLWKYLPEDMKAVLSAVYPGAKTFFATAKEGDTFTFTVKDKPFVAEKEGSFFITYFTK